MDRQLFDRRLTAEPGRRGWGSLNPHGGVCDEFKETTTEYSDGNGETHHETDIEPTGFMVMRFEMEAPEATLLRRWETGRATTRATVEALSKLKDTIEIRRRVALLLRCREERRRRRDAQAAHDERAPRREAYDEACCDHWAEEPGEDDDAWSSWYDAHPRHYAQFAGATSDCESEELETEPIVSNEDAFWRIEKARDDWLPMEYELETDDENDVLAYLARTHSDCELWNFWRDDDRHRENREAARTRLRSLIEHVVGVSEAQVRAAWRFIVFVYAPLMLWTRRAKFRAQFAPGAPLVRALAAGYGAGPMNGACARM